MILGVSRDSLIERLKRFGSEVSLNDVVYAFTEECKKEDYADEEIEATREEVFCK